MFYTTIRKKAKQTNIIFTFPWAKIFGKQFVPEDQTLHLLEGSCDKKRVFYLLVISNIPGELFKIQYLHFDTLATEELWTLLLQNS